MTPRPRKPVPKIDNKKASTTRSKPSARPPSPAAGPEKRIPPTRAPFPVVALGASAGGLHALEEFFAQVPVASGMAFVVVTHQDPSRKSLMPELLGRAARLPVVEIKDGTSVESDHLYVAPPGARLRLADGRFHLAGAAAPGAPLVLPIDGFLRSLAHERKRSAIAVILSGTGTDGALGVQAIKAESGLVAAQSPSTAEFAGMPAAAIATGAVDLSLPAGEIPERLLAYAKGPYLSTPEQAAEVALPLGAALQQIVALLRSRTGHDFSGYKTTTIRRRIERRMALFQLERIEDYLLRLQEDRAEGHALFKELLIGVTSFFRDPAAFEVLASRALPELLASKPGGASIRVWVPACGTGEEAYSIVIVLLECLDRLSKDLTIQVFATDLDADAVETARAGRYPAGIAADVGPERLRRYFTREGDHWLVNRDLRERIVFAPQNLLKDPPFTRIDLISCRNLLIYFERPAQDRVLPLLHYALSPSGILFLGSAESVGPFEELFSPIDRQWKIFQRAGPWPSVLPQPLSSLLGIRGLGAADPTRDGDGADLRTAVPESLRSLLASCYAPPTVLVDGHGRILQIHGRVGAFLEVAPGQASLSVLTLAREGLRSALASALHAAARRDGEVVHRDVELDLEGERFPVRLAVRKIADRGALRGMLTITFESTPPPARRPRPQRGAAAKPSGGRVAQLESELLHTREDLWRTIGELQSANEDLTSFTEEVQSVNEELQSTNEELETSREEMQSLNEELQTVNAELQSKIETLSEVNDDLRNLLDGTQIATIFVDRALRVKRFTKEARKVIPLIESDIGRPIADMMTSLEYPDLMRDLEEVLQKAAQKELQVHAKDGEWYSLRISPYRTSSERVDGVVLTLVEITRTRQAEQRLREALDLAESIVDTVRDPLVILDTELRVVSASLAFHHLFHTQPVDVARQPIDEIAGRRLDAPRLRRLLEQVVASGGSFNDFELECELPEMGKSRLLLNARRVEREGRRTGLILLGAEKTESGSRREG